MDNVEKKGNPMFKPCNRCGYFKAEGDVDMLAEERPACVREDCPVNLIKHAILIDAPGTVYEGTHRDILLDDFLGHARAPGFNARWAVEEE